MQLARPTRDALMFLLGFGGFVHELWTSGGERPTILLGCLALMGFPVFLRKDEAEVARPAPAEPAGKVELPAAPAAPEALVAPSTPPAGSSDTRDP